MTDRKQGAGLSSGSSAAVHRKSWNVFIKNLHFFSTE